MRSWHTTRRGLGRDSDTKDQALTYRELLDTHSGLGTCFQGIPARHGQPRARWVSTEGAGPGSVSQVQIRVTKPGAPPLGAAAWAWHQAHTHTRAVHGHLSGNKHTAPLFSEKLAIKPRDPGISEQPFSVSECFIQNHCGLKIKTKVSPLAHNCSLVCGVRLDTHGYNATPAGFCVHATCTASHVYCFSKDLILPISQKS